MDILPLASGAIFTLVGVVVGAAIARMKTDDTK